MDCAKVKNNIQLELERYIDVNNIRALVCGDSGGIDSCATIALASEVCSAKNIPLIGRSIPIVTNKNDEIERARLVGNAFCTDFAEKDLSVFFGTLLYAMDSSFSENTQTTDFDEKIRIGNFKARARMMYLYDIARKYNGLVLSTDNYTELLLGFWTLHGDVGDLGMLQNLWKTEVYELSEHLCSYHDATKSIAIRQCIEATPTDGLGITSSDVEQLGVKSYDEADMILKAWLKNQPDEYKNHPIVQRYQKTHFKRNNPYNFSRELVFG